MPKSLQPFIVIYEEGKNVLQKKFVELDQAQNYIDENKGSQYILGLYDFNNRQVLSAGLPVDGIRSVMLDEFIQRQLPEVSEQERVRAEHKRLVKVVYGYYLQKFGIIGLAAGASYVTNVFLHWCIEPLFGVGLAAFFYGGGTLGYLILWKIQTWGGATPPEVLNERLLTISYVLGTVFTVLSLQS